MFLGKIFVCSHIDLKKQENLFKKAKQVHDELSMLFSRYNIEKVFIEESLFKFSFGKSSAKTLATLTKFNRGYILDNL